VALWPYICARYHSCLGCSLRRECLVRAEGHGSSPVATVTQPRREGRPWRAACRQAPGGAGFRGSRPALRHTTPKPAPLVCVNLRVGESRRRPKPSLLCLARIPKMGALGRHQLDRKGCRGGATAGGGGQGAGPTKKRETEPGGWLPRCISDVHLDRGPSLTRKRPGSARQPLSSSFESQNVSPRSRAIA
jgi:hypothetical protein